MHKVKIALHCLLESGHRWTRINVADLPKPGETVVSVWVGSHKWTFRITQPFVSKNVYTNIHHYQVVPNDPEVNQKLQHSMTAPSSNWFLYIE